MNSSPSNIQEDKTFPDENPVASQTALVQAVVLAIDFRTEDDSLRQEDFMPRWPL